MEHRLYYKVQLLSSNSKEGAVPVFTTDVLDTLYDCHEFIHWLSCQLSSAIFYRIVEFVIDDEFRYVHSYPINSKEPTKCKYYPPTPLYLHIKKKRRQERNHLGLYYEYE